MRIRLLPALLVASLAIVACGDDTSVFDLSVGDCFNDDPAGAQVIQTVATVDCSGTPRQRGLLRVLHDRCCFPGP